MTLKDSEPEKQKNKSKKQKKQYEQLEFSEKENSSIEKLDSYASLENILEKTKSEISKKLKDLKAAAIKVQLEGKISSFAFKNGMNAKKSC